jgi:hypothetical protein
MDIARGAGAICKKDAKLRAPSGVERRFDQ